MDMMQVLLNQLSGGGLKQISRQVGADGSVLDDLGNIAGNLFGKK